MAQKNDLTATFGFEYQPGDAVQKYQADLKKIVDASKKASKEQASVIQSVAGNLAKAFDQGEIGKVESFIKGITNSLKDLNAAKPQVFTEAFLKQAKTSRSALIQVFTSASDVIAKTFKGRFGTISTELGASVEKMVQQGMKAISQGKAFDPIKVDVLREKFGNVMAFYRRTGLAADAEINRQRDRFSNEEIVRRIEEREVALETQRRLRAAQRLTSSLERRDIQENAKSRAEAIPASRSRVRATKLTDMEKLEGASPQAYTETTKRVQTLSSETERLTAQNEALMISSTRLMSALQRLDATYSTLTDKEKKRAATKPAFKLQDASREVLAAVAEYQKFGGSLGVIGEQVQTALTNPLSTLIATVKTVQQLPALKLRVAGVDKTALEALNPRLEGETEAQFKKRILNLASARKEAEQEGKKTSSAIQAAFIKPSEELAKRIAEVRARLARASKTSPLGQALQAELDTLNGFQKQYERFFAIGEGKIGKLYVASRERRIKEIREDGSEVNKAIMEQAKAEANLETRLAREAARAAGVVKPETATGTQRKTVAAADRARKVQQLFERYATFAESNIIGESFSETLGKMNDSEKKLYGELLRGAESATKIVETLYKKTEGGRYMTIRRVRRTGAEIAKARDEVFNAETGLLAQWAEFYKGLKPDDRKSLRTLMDKSQREGETAPLNLAEMIVGRAKALAEERIKGSLATEGKRPTKRLSPEALIPKDIVDPFQQEMYAALAQMFAIKKGKGLEDLVKSIPEKDIRDLAGKMLNRVKKDFNGELAKKGVLASKDTVDAIGNALWTSITPQGGIRSREVNKLRGIVDKVVKSNTSAFEYTQKEIGTAITQLLSTARKQFNDGAAKADKISQDGLTKITERLGGITGGGNAEVRRLMADERGGWIRNLTNLILGGEDVVSRVKKDFDSSKLGEQLRSLTTDFLKKNTGNILDPKALDKFKSGLSSILTGEGGLLPKRELVNKAFREVANTMAGAPRELKKIFRDVTNALYTEQTGAQQIDQRQAAMAKRMFGVERFLKTYNVEATKIRPAMEAAAYGANLDLLEGIAAGTKGAYDQFLKSASKPTQEQKLMVNGIFKRLDQNLADAVKAAKAAKKTGGLTEKELAKTDLAGTQFAGIGLRLAEGLKQIGPRGQMGAQLKAGLTQIIKDLVSLKPLGEWKPSDINKIIDTILPISELNKAQKNRAGKLFNEVFGPALKEARVAEAKFKAEMEKSRASVPKVPGAVDDRFVDPAYIKSADEPYAQLRELVKARAEAAGMTAKQVEKYVNMFMKANSRWQTVLAGREKEAEARSAAAALEVQQKERQKVLDGYLKSVEREGNQLSYLKNQIQYKANQMRPEDLRKQAAALQQKLDAYNFYLEELRANTAKSGRKARQQAAAVPSGGPLTLDQLAILGADKIVNRDLQAQLKSQKSVAEKILRVVNDAIKIQEKAEAKAAAAKVAAAEKKSQREAWVQRQIDNKTLRDALKTEKANSAAQENAQKIAAQFRAREDERILAESLNYEKKNIANLNRAKKIAADFAKAQKEKAAAPAPVAEVLPETVVPKTDKVKRQASRAVAVIEDATKTVVKALDTAAKTTTARRRKAPKAEEVLPIPPPAAIVETGAKAATAIGAIEKDVKAALKKFTFGMARPQTGRPRGDASWLYGLPDASVVTKTAKVIRDSVDRGYSGIDDMLAKRGQRRAVAAPQLIQLLPDAKDVARAWQGVRSVTGQELKALDELMSRAAAVPVRPTAPPTGDIVRSMLGEPKLLTGKVIKAFTAVKESVDWGARDIETFLARRRPAKAVAMPVPLPTQKQVAQAFTAVRSSVSREFTALESVISNRAGSWMFGRPMAPPSPTAIRQFIGDTPRLVSDALLRATGAEAERMGRTMFTGVKMGTPKIDLFGKPDRKLLEEVTQSTLADPNWQVLKNLQNASRFVANLRKQQATKGAPIVSQEEEIALKSVSTFLDQMQKSLKGYGVMMSRAKDGTVEFYSQIAKGKNQWQSITHDTGTLMSVIEEVVRDTAIASDKIRREAAKTAEAVRSAQEVRSKLPEGARISGLLSPTASMEDEAKQINKAKDLAKMRQKITEGITEAELAAARAVKEGARTAEQQLVIDAERLRRRKEEAAVRVAASAEAKKEADFVKELAKVQEQMRQQRRAQGLGVENTAANQKALADASYTALVKQLGATETLRLLRQQLDSGTLKSQKEIETNLVRQLSLLEKMHKAGQLTTQDWKQQAAQLTSIAKDQTLAANIEKVFGGGKKQKPVTAADLTTIEPGLLNNWDKLAALQDRVSSLDFKNQRELNKNYSDQAKVIKALASEIDLTTAAGRKMYEEMKRGAALSYQQAQPALAQKNAAQIASEQARITKDFEAQLARAARGSLTQFGNMEQFENFFINLRKSAETAFKAIGGDSSRLVARVDGEFARLAPLMEQKLRRVNIGMALSQQFETLDSRLNQLSYRFQHVSWQMSLLGGLGVAAITKAVQAASKFSGEIAPVAATMASNNNEMEKFDEIVQQITKSSMEMSTQTVFSTTEINKALGALAQTGLEIEQIYQVLPDVLQFAAAGNLNLEEAVRSAISAMTAFDLKAGEITTVTRAMTSAALLTNANVEDLTEAFKHVGPVASMAGMSIEETAAAVGRLSQAGIRGSMAGTGLKRAISELLAPTGKAEKLLRSLGVDAIDPTTKMLKPMTEVIDEFNAAFERIGPTADKTGIIMQIFGMRAGPAMAALITQGSAKLKELEDRLNIGADQAAAIAEKRAKSLEGLFKRIGQAINNLRVEIGKTLENPLITFLLEAGTNLLDVFRKIVSTPVGQFLTGIIVTMGGFVAVTMTAVGALAMFTSALAGVVSLLATLSKGGGMAGIKGLGNELWAMFTFGATSLKRMTAETQAMTLSQKEMAMVMKALPIEMKLALDATARLTAAEKEALIASRSAIAVRELEILKNQELALSKDLIVAATAEEKVAIQADIVALREKIALTEREVLTDRELAASEEQVTAATKEEAAAHDLNAAAVAAETQAKKRLEAENLKTAGTSALSGAAAGGEAKKRGLFSFLFFGRGAKDTTKGIEEVTKATTRLGKVGEGLKRTLGRGLLANIFGGPIGWLLDIYLAYGLIKSIAETITGIINKPDKKIGDRLAQFEEYKDAFEGKAKPTMGMIVKMTPEQKDQYKKDADGYLGYWRAKLDEIQTEIDTSRMLTLYVSSGQEKLLAQAKENVRAGEVLIGTYERAQKKAAGVDVTAADRLQDLTQEMMGKMEGIEGISGLMKDMAKSIDDVNAAYKEVVDSDAELRRNQKTSATVAKKSFEEMRTSLKTVTDTFYEKTTIGLNEKQTASQKRYAEILGKSVVAEKMLLEERITNAQEAYRINTTYQAEEVAAQKAFAASRVGIVKTYLDLELGIINKHVEATKDATKATDEGVLDVKRLIYKESLKQLRDYHKDAVKAEKAYQLESAKINIEIAKSIEAANKRFRAGNEPPEGIIAAADQTGGLFQMLQGAQKAWDEFYDNLEARNEHLRNGQFELAQSAQAIMDTNVDAMSKLKSQLFERVYKGATGSLRVQLETETEIGKATRDRLDLVDRLNHLSRQQQESVIVAEIKKIEEAEKRAMETAADIGKTKLAANEELRNINLKYLRDLESVMKNIRTELTKISGVMALTEFNVLTDDSRAGAREMMDFINAYEKALENGEPVDWVPQAMLARAEQMSKIATGLPAAMTKSNESAFKEQNAVAATAAEQQGKTHEEKLKAGIESGGKQGYSTLQTTGTSTAAAVGASFSEEIERGISAAFKNIGTAAASATAASGRVLNKVAGDVIPGAKAISDYIKESIQYVPEAVGWLVEKIGYEMRGADEAVSKWADLMEGKEQKALPFDIENWRAVEAALGDGMFDLLDEFGIRLGSNIEAGAVEALAKVKQKYAQVTEDLRRGLVSDSDLSRVKQMQDDLLKLIGALADYRRRLTEAKKAERDEAAKAAEPPKMVEGRKMTEAALDAMKKGLQGYFTNQNGYIDFVPYAQGASKAMQTSMGGLSEFTRQALASGALKLGPPLAGAVKSAIDEGIAKSKFYEPTFSELAKASGQFSYEGMDSSKVSSAIVQDTGKILDNLERIQQSRGKLVEQEVTVAGAKMTAYVYEINTAAADAVEARFLAAEERVSDLLAALAQAPDGSEKLANEQQIYELNKKANEEALATAREELRLAAEAYRLMKSGQTEKPKYATGGHLKGYGGGDIIPALLEPGEFVLRKEAVRKYGAHRIAAINDSAIPRFQEGGMVKKKWWEREGTIDAAIKQALMPAARPLESDTAVDANNVISNAAKSIAAVVYETFTDPGKSLGSMGQLLIGGYNKIVPSDLKVPGQAEAEAAFENAFKVPSLEELYQNPLGPAMAVGMIGGAAMGGAGLKKSASVEAARATIAEAVKKAAEPVMNERGSIQLGPAAPAESLNLGKNNRPSLIAEQVSKATAAGLQKFDLQAVYKGAGQATGQPIFEIDGGRSLADLQALARGQETAVYIPKNTDMTNPPATVTKVPYPKSDSPVTSSLAEAEARYKSMITEFLSRDRVIGGGTMKHTGFYEYGDQKIPVFEQKYFEGRPASEMMVDKYMADRGFTRAPKSTNKWEYERREGDNLRVVGDLLGGGEEGRSKNVIFTKDGKVEVIDSMMRLVKWAQVEAARKAGRPGFREGGMLDGFGGGDIVPAMLEPGEFVMRKEAVKTYGTGFFNMLNGLKTQTTNFATMLKKVKGFASGGQVGAAMAPAVAGVYNLNLTLGGQTYPLQGEKRIIEALVEKLRREGLTS